MDYSRYTTLAINRRGENGAVLDIQMRAKNGKLPTAGHDGHRELAQIWRDVNDDESVRCAVLRGEGMGFSGGGDLDLVADMANDFEVRTRVWKEARDLVYNVINCDKPIVSATGQGWPPPRRLSRCMARPSGRAWLRGCWPTFRLRQRAPRSLMAIRAWASRRATTQPSCGRFYAEWPRPSTT